MALAAAITAASGGAFATDTADDNWDHIATMPGVEVSIREYGDVIKVCDTAANGFAAITRVGDRYADNFYTIKTSGKGSCVTRQASQGGVYNLPENERISLGFQGETSTSYGGGFLNDNEVNRSDAY
ncbi:hypothetical protein ACWHLZ_46435 [Streptomyces chartreusis]